MLSIISECIFNPNTHNLLCLVNETSVQAQHYSLLFDLVRKKVADNQHERYRCC